jgi:hypothetical protein
MTTADPLDPADPGRREPSVTWSIATFNRICYAIALLWIGGALLLSLRAKVIEKGGHEFHDFSQFYMGGLIARHHAWDALYPIPHAGSVNSPGEWEESDPRPAYAELAEEAGVPAQSSRFIQPPPFALMVEPIAFLKYPLAKKAWNLLMVLCAWGVAVMAGKSFELAARRSSPIAGGLALLVAVSPLTLDTLRFMNVSPLIALLIGFSAFGLLCKHSEGGALALVVGAASKYATAMLVPLYIAMRKWRALIVMAVPSAAIVGGSLAIMKTSSPYRTFFNEMVPTFTRTHTDVWNRSLPALAMHLAEPGAAKPAPLHGAWLVGVRVLQWGSLLGLLAILFTRKPEFWSDPAHVLAAASSLLAWFLIFSPILWDHYLMYLSTFWGWVAWEGRRSWLRAALAAFVIVYPNLPDFVLERHITRSITLAGPHECGVLLSVIVMMLIGAWRLLEPVDRPQEDAQERRTTFSFTTVQFNRACAAAAGLWLIVAVPAVIHGAPGWKDKPLLGRAAQWDVDKGDFPQFYMGGVMARLRSWDSLYPIPNPTSRNNAGMPADSAMRPRYAAEAERRGVGNRLRYIQPPPVALLLLPMGYLSYHRAFQIWTLLLIVSGWGIAVLAGKLFETLCRRPTRGAGLIIVLVALSPLMLHAIVIANMSVLVGLCIAVALLGLLRQRDALPAAAIVLGGVTKYATLALLPLAVAMRRWMLVLWAIVFGAALLGGSYALMKAEPFHTYSHDIAPTLSHVHEIETNQSVLGFLSRASHHGGDVSKPVRVTVWVVAALALAALLWLVLRRPPAFWTEPAHVLAAATALLTWLLIFSPVFWEHYPVYLCPIWAWLIWEAQRSWLRGVLGAAAIASMYVPFTFLFDFKEPLNTHMLPGAIVMLALGVWRLMTPSGEITGETPVLRKGVTPVSQTHSTAGAASAG